MKDIIYFLRYLYGLIRYRLFVWLFMAVGAAILEGAGVALFLPILEAGETEGRVAEITRAVFQFLHVQYSFPVLLAVMVTFFLLRGALFAFQELYVRRIIAKLFLSLRSEFVGKFFQSEYQFVLGKNIGSITNAATQEFQRVLACLEQSLAVVIASGFVVIYFCIPLVIDPVLTIAVIALVPFGYLVSRAINRRMRQYSIESSAARSRLQSYLIEAFQNFK